MTEPFAQWAAKPSAVACVVAHPDDETLWAGGTFLLHPEWSLYIAGLCRGSDPDRAPRFRRALTCLDADGTLGDLDDGPAQDPLPDAMVQEAVLALLPPRRYALLFTHAPWGEYTRHRRHMETSRAVLSLWQAGRLEADEVCLFAYDDEEGRSLPRAERRAHHLLALSEAVWQKKYQIITEVYGFREDSWEARATPREEAFWSIASPQHAYQWLQGGKRAG